MALTRLASLLHNLLHKQRDEYELDEEVRAHQLLLADEKIRAGMKPQEAHRQARLELGGLEQVKEHIREVRAGHLLECLGFSRSTTCTSTSCACNYPEARNLTADGTSERVPVMQAAARDLLAHGQTVRPLPEGSGGVSTGLSGRVMAYAETVASNAIAMTSK